MAVRTILKQPEKNAQRDPGEKGWACCYCWKEGQLKLDCPQACKPPLAPCPVCKGPHWKRDCPQRHRFQGSDSQDNQDWRCPGVPTQAPVLITPEEPQVLITVGGQSVNFLLDTGATYPWPTFFLIRFSNGTIWKSQKMGLIIFVSLLLVTPKILSLPFDPQDNVLLSWAHCYAEFHNQSNCWVCGVLPSSSVEIFPWWTSPLQGKDFLQVCKYLQQQSHVMPLLKLMTSNNLKIDWCNYGHNVTFHFDLNLF